MADFSQYTNQFKERIHRFPGWIKQKLYRLRKVRPDWRKAFSIALFTTAVGILSLLLFCIAVYQGAFGPLPTYAELKDIKNYNASEVYADDGVILGKYYIENRISADFEEITPNLINALIATEDARFFEHRGVDLRAFLRVVIKSILLFDESSGGGSTLSQQLAKNLFPRQHYGPLTLPVAKIKEMLVARRLEQVYSKEQLLNLYLNTVPFGENVYGIKVASRKFFNKAPEKLRTEEAAMLVGMLKANTRYSPVRNPERALTRRNTVINQMAKYAYLSQKEADSLKSLPLELDYRRDGSNRGLATYFREHLRQVLEETLQDIKKADGTPYNLYTDGLKVYTTINSRMQRYAEEAVEEQMAKIQAAFDEHWKDRIPWGNEDNLRKAVQQTVRYRQLKKKGLSKKQIEEIFNRPVHMNIFDWEKGNISKIMSPLDSVKYYLTLLNTGFLAIEPGTGLIRAWVGGIDHQFFKYDHIKSKRQVGSTFKPVVYASALQNGMLPCEYTQNQRLTYTTPDNKQWTPKNADGKYEGVYSMEGGLSHSINTVTVQIMQRSTLDSVRQLAAQMGITSPIIPMPAIALGAVEASLWDMVRVYGTFANRGKRPDLHYLDRIETRDGKLLAEFQRPNPRYFKTILREDHAAMMIKMMESVVDSGTARRLKYEFRLYNDIAGKTGTTQNHTDGWFLGFTPKLVAGAWVGADDPRIHFRSMRLGQGSKTALPIWGRFMSKVFEDPEFKPMKYAKFPPLVDTTWALMQCPPFLEEMPVIAGLQTDYQQNPTLYNQLYSDLADYRDQEINSQLRQRRPNESDAEYYERMREYNERINQREGQRENLKKFWSDVLFGDKKNQNNR